MSKWVTGTVTDVIRWTDSLFSLRVKADIDPFTAGQFGKLAREIDGERLQRAFSFVNAPDDQELEFYLVNVVDGALSPKLHELEVGDSLLVSRKSTGYFVLDEVPACNELWLMATGTGISPCLSILQAGKDLERFKQIVLVYAVRYAEDLSYLPLIRELEQKYAGKLRLQTVTSREKTADALYGRIPALIESGELEKSVGLTLSPEQSHVMLCGNPEMVRDTQSILKQQREMHKHLRRKPGHITSEHYW